MIPQVRETLGMCSITLKPGNYLIPIKKPKPLPKVILEIKKPNLVAQKEKLIPNTVVEDDETIVQEEQDREDQLKEEKLNN
jgi:hypothetical protein